MLLIITIFLILCSLLSYQFIRYEAIATTYKYMLTIVFMIIMCFFALKYMRTQFTRIKSKMSPKDKKKNYKTKRLTSTVLMIVLTLCIGFVNTYYYSLNHLIMTKITDYEIKEDPKIKCDVYALKNSTITSLSDSSIQKIGVLLKDKNGVVKAPVKQLLKKEYNTEPSVVFLSYLNRFIWWFN